MEVLPAALRPLARYRQFIRVRAWPDPKRPGKTIKMPVHPVTGEATNAHDPAIWRSFDELAGGGLIGFVFTERDPFFFLDIDNALQPDGTWNDAATMLCQRFAGAAVEVSQSGSGLHIIGSGKCPPHGCDNQALGSQFYTQERFVLLTGTHAHGDAASDHTAALDWLVGQHFPEALGTVRGEWQEGPVAEWRGPTDDDELIRRAMRSQSATALFGAGASFADLWAADEAILATAFPGDREPINRSAADAALASHLAFWTGCDGPRIERLMRQSALVRGKWDREDYLPRTIARVCEPGRAVCQDRAESVIPEPDEGKTLSDPVVRPSIQEIARTAEQAELFRGCAYVIGSKGVWSTAHAQVLSGPVFDAVYGGRLFTLDPSQDKPDGSAYKAFTQSRALRWPIVASTQFRPELAPGEVFEAEGSRYVNSYVPVPVRRVDGDVAPFLRHVEKLFPVSRDRDIVLSYMAACVQLKGVKFQWCPVIQGVPGNGKSLLSRCVIAAVGERHSYTPQAGDLADRFNDWLLDKVFYAVEDIYVAEDRADEVIENLKPMVTNDRLQVQGKGEKKETRRVCGNFIMNMNRRDGLRKERNDRRFAIFFTPQQDKADLERDGMTGGYFQRLYEWLRDDGYAIVTEYLHRYRISDEVRDSLLGEAPITSSHEAVRAAAGGLVEEAIQEAIEEGRQGFRKGWISFTHLRALMGTVRRSNVRLATLRDIMADMGYVPHPGLPDGRTDNPVAVDQGKRSKLYVRQDHASVRWTARGEIARQYEADQLDEPFSGGVAASHLQVAK